MAIRAEEWRFGSASFSSKCGISWFKFLEFLLASILLFHGYQEVTMARIYFSIALALLIVVASSSAYAEDANLSTQESGHVEIERSVQQRRVGIAHTAVGISTGAVGLGLGITAIAATVDISLGGGDMYALPLILGITSAISLAASAIFLTVGARIWAREDRRAEQLRMASRLPSLTVAMDRRTSAYSFGLSMTF